MKENVCFELKKSILGLEYQRKGGRLYTFKYEKSETTFARGTFHSFRSESTNGGTFCKSIGISWYREFKYYLVAELAGEEEQKISAMYGYPISKTDQIDEVPAKTIATTIQILEDTLKSISIDTFSKVIDAITHANRIDIYGVENSGTTISDLVTKMLYLGINCRYFKDYYLQRICASSLEKGDVAIGISYSGCSKDTVDVVKIAKKRGATVIVITKFFRCEN